MTLTKEKNNTHKQRTLPNDERLFGGSNVHETDINGCQWHSLPIRRLMRHSCDQAFRCDRGRAERRMKGRRVRVTHVRHTKSEVLDVQDVQA